MTFMPTQSVSTQLRSRVEFSFVNLCCANSLETSNFTNLIYSLVKTIVSAFHGITSQHAQLFPDNNSGSGRMGLLHLRKPD